MRKLFCLIALAGALPLLTACEPSVEEERQDVIETQRDVQQNVAEEQQDVREAQQEGAQQIQEERQDVREAQIEQQDDAITPPPSTVP